MQRLLEGLNLSTKSAVLKAPTDAGLGGNNFLGGEVAVLGLGRLELELYFTDEK